MKNLKILLLASPIIALVPGTLAFLIDFYLCLEDGNVVKDALILSMRSTVLITLCAYVATMMAAITFSLLDKLKPKVLLYREKLAILLAVGLFGAIFPWFFDISLNQFVSLIIAQVIGFIVAVTIFIVALLLFRRYEIDSFFSSFSAKPALGVLAVIILFSGSFLAGGRKEGEPQLKSEPQPKGPNVILIVMDTVRADRMSLYGYTRKTTPFLEELAANSAVFENAFSPGSWTPPAHGSLFTGLYPSQHKIHGEHHWLYGEFRTLAEILSDSGYRTVSFSNNHYVSSMTNMTQGFQETWHKGEWTDTLSLPRRSLGGAVVSFLSWLMDRINVRVRAKIIKNPAQMWDYPTAKTTNEAFMTWFEENRDTTNPFFIYFNYMEAHDPYNPEEEYARLFLTPKELEKSYRLQIRYPPGEWNWDLSKSNYTKDDLRIMNLLYDACIRMIDEELKSFIDKLSRAGVLDNTLLIITSDHGEYLGTHNRTGHGAGLHDQLLHIPLVVRYPKLFPPGTRTDKPVNLIDVFETILSVAGIEERPKGITGAVALNNIESVERTYSPAESLFQLNNFVNASFTDNQSKWFQEYKSLRGLEYHYIWASRGKSELYNVVEDPFETTNILEEKKSVGEALDVELWNWFNHLYIRPATEIAVTVSERDIAKMIEKLRAVGYVK
jgi:arylsulfatase A-like enzyme